MSMYLRVKRMKETVFLRVNPTDSFANVKAKLGGILGKEANDLRIIGSDKERIFEDEATVGDQEVENDAIVYVVYRLGEGETWEIVQVSTGAEADEGKVEDKK